MASRLTAGKNGGLSKISSQNLIKNITQYHQKTSRSYGSDRPFAVLPSKIHVLPNTSKLRRFLYICAIGTFFSGLGLATTARPAFKTAYEFLNPPTDQETLSLFTPENERTRDIEGLINKHPLTLQMRSNPEFTESRPHLKIPKLQRPNNFTAGPLMGPDRLVVPPFVWINKKSDSLVTIAYIGKELCGHPGLIHGGLLATLLDESFARCCFPKLPNRVGMTANLNIDYRNALQEGNFVVLRANTTKVEGRKAWVNGNIETLTGEDEKPVIIAQASALFIEPRQAAAMARLSPVQ